MRDIPAFGPGDLNVMFVGIAIVFLILLLITCILYLFPLIFRNGKKSDKKNKTQKAAEPLPVNKAVDDKIQAVVIPETNNDDKVTVEVTGSDEELVAVISAAITAFMEENGYPAGSFRVKSFRRVGASAGQWQKSR